MEKGEEPLGNVHVAVARVREWCTSYKLSVFPGHLFFIAYRLVFIVIFICRGETDILFLTLSVFASFSFNIGTFLFLWLILD